LIGERRVGTRRYYSLRRDGLVELRNYVEGFWEEALASFKAAAERGDKDEASDG
jgi:hypothetical protein